MVVNLKNRDNDQVGESRLNSSSKLHIVAIFAVQFILGIASSRSHGFLIPESVH
jgi:hypothetical protein